jgi:hypothetical protein
VVCRGSARHGRFPVGPSDKLLPLRTARECVSRAVAGGDHFSAGPPVSLKLVLEARVTSLKESVVLRDVSGSDGALRLRYAPPAPGQYAVSRALEPRSTRTTVSGLVSFLEREGARPEAERVVAAGLLTSTDSVTYIHSAYAMSSSTSAPTRNRYAPANSSFRSDSRCSTSPQRSGSAIRFACRCSATGGHLQRTAARCGRGSPPAQPLRKCPWIRPRREASVTGRSRRTRGGSRASRSLVRARGCSARHTCDGRQARRPNAWT